MSPTSYQTAPPRTSIINNAIATVKPQLTALGSAALSCKMFRLEHSSTVLVFVDGSVGMIIAPVEPVVFQRGDAGQTFSLRRAGGGAALEVPLARRGCVEHRPVFPLSWCVGACLQKEFGVVAIDAAPEDSEGFAVGAEDN